MPCSTQSIFHKPPGAADDPVTVVADDDNADPLFDDALQDLFGRHRLWPRKGRAAGWVEGDGVFAVTPLIEAPDAIELDDEVLHSLVVSLEGVESNFDLANELFGLLRLFREQLLLPFAFHFFVLFSAPPAHFVVFASFVPLTAALGQATFPLSTSVSSVDVRRCPSRRSSSLVERVEVDGLDADGCIQDSMHRFIEPLILLCQTRVLLVATKGPARSKLSGHRVRAFQYVVELLDAFCMTDALEPGGDEVGAADESVVRHAPLKVAGDDGR